MTTARKDAFDFEFEALKGGNLPLSVYRGGALLIVNTASECGFTPQYKDLQALSERYASKGLTVIGVPSNDFGNQEPGDAKVIDSFCDVTYGVTFPMAAKTHVSGAGAHPFYRWASDQVGLLGRPRWNFHKILIGRDGQVAHWFSSVTNPCSTKVVRAIEAALDSRVDAPVS